MPNPFWFRPRQPAFRIEYARLSPKRAATSSRRKPRSVLNPPAALSRRKKPLEFALRRSLEDRVRRRRRRHRHHVSIVAAPAEEQPFRHPVVQAAQPNVEPLKLDHVDKPIKFTRKGALKLAVPVPGSMAFTDPSLPVPRLVNDPENFNAYRVQYLREVFGIAFDSKDRLVRMQFIAFHSISARTFRSYSSTWNSMIKLKLPLNDEGLAYYLYHRFGQLKHGSHDSTTAAVHVYMSCTLADKNWSKFRKRIDLGVRMLHPDGLPEQRGGISPEMFESMIARPYIQKTIYEQGLVLQYAFALRTEQITNLRFQDLKPTYDTQDKDEIVNFTYVAPRHKNRGTTPGVEMHQMDQRFLAEVIDIYNRAKLDPAAPVVPGWKPRISVSLVKRAAEDLGWDELVKWVNHSIKHGSAMNAGDEAEDQTEEGRDAAVAARTDHKNKGVREHYAQPAEKRHMIADARKRLLQGDINRGLGRALQGSGDTELKFVTTRAGLAMKKTLDASKKKAKAAEVQKTAAKKKKECEKLKRCHAELSKKNEKKNNNNQKKKK